MHIPVCTYPYTYIHTYLNKSKEKIFNYLDHFYQPIYLLGNSDSNPCSPFCLSEEVRSNKRTRFYIP